MQATAAWQRGALVPPKRDSWPVCGLRAASALRQLLITHRACQRDRCSPLMATLIFFSARTVPAGTACEREQNGQRVKLGAPACHRPPLGRIGQAARNAMPDARQHPSAPPAAA
jgi:hypothetical protein